MLILLFESRLKKAVYFNDDILYSVFNSGEVHKLIRGPENIFTQSVKVLKARQALQDIYFDKVNSSNSVIDQIYLKKA